MKTLLLIQFFAMLIYASVSHAQDTLLADACFPVENATNLLKVTNLKSDQRDTVDSFLEAYFVDVEMRSLPMKLYLKYDGSRDEFFVNEKGQVLDFHAKVLDAPKYANICGLTQTSGKIGVAMSTSVHFKNRTGMYTFAEIFDGLKDGKSHHKNNLGGIKAMFVPRMTHVAIIYDNREISSNVSVSVNGSNIDVETTSYGEMHVIEAERLKELKPDFLIIRGGPYNLFPVPSIQKMKSLGIK